MPFDIGLFKRQRYVQPSITSFGGYYVTADYSTSTTYAVHVFTSSGAFTYPAYLTSSTARVFLVGGGGGGNGGGGNSQGGGGGAGGVLSSSTYSLSPGSTYAVAVGSGGAISVGGNYSSIRSPTDTTYSGSFTGSTDYITLPSSSSAYNLTGDFTFEAWVYANAQAGNDWGVFDARVSGGSAAAWLVNLSNQGTGHKVNFYNAGSNFGVTTIPLNTWAHIAVTRSGSALRIFVNGVQDYINAAYGTAAISPGTTAPRIGTKDATGTTYTTRGYISNLRLVKGTALYTSSFVPPTNALTSASSPSLYAVSLSGGSYLSIPNSTVFDFGSGNFTFESWIHPTSLSAQGIILAKTNDSSQYGQYEFRLNTNGTLVLYVSTSGTTWNITLTTATALSINTWYHIALTRNTGGVFTIWINGTSAATVTNNLTIWTSTWPVTIGNYRSGTSTPFTGYLSNYRIVKGIAVYTGAFTPPTWGVALETTQSAGTNIAEILTASDVSLLTAKSATIVDNSTYAQTITLTGTPTPSVFTATLYSTSLLTLQDATFKDNSANNFTLTPAGSVTITNTSTYTPPLGQTAWGGGTGAPGSVSNQVGYGGASGGGSSVWNFNGTILGGGNIPGQGNTGGGATGAGSNFASGGGGGAGSAGGQGNAGTNIGGAGGTGTFTTFFSTTIAITAQIGQYITATNAVYFGGGGGGGGNGTTNVGGWGGGGSAGWAAAAITGSTNSGGGGGSAAGTAAAGGSGVVVITYPLPATVSAVDTTPTDPYFKNTSLLLSNQEIVTPISVDYLVVAGGGGGGVANGGGGGAGGLLTGTISTLTTYTSYSVSVGGGGTGQPSGGGSSGAGGNSVFSSIVSTGGGAYTGSGGGTAGTNGGSGGGGGNNNGTAGTGVAGQGNAGGAGNFNPPAGGGGGGAGAAGTAATGSSGGAGGTGTFTTLISTTTAITLGIGQYVTATNAIYFAGGGAGANGATDVSGGLGGGGAAGISSAGGVSGLPNSGGGGGGTGNGNGGAGGSGVVLLRISNAYTAYFSSGITAVPMTDNGYNIYSVTSGTGTVLFAPAPVVASVSVDYLVVAGGGGGGANDAGGGGAGGLLTSTGYTLSTGFTYNVIVGAGGAGAVNNAQGTNGNDSVLSLFRSYGGGGGGRDANSTLAAQAGLSGGSGGGGGGTTSGSVGGSGVAEQGNAGGGGGGASGYGGGGGGGAGSTGTTTVSGASGNGGVGLQSSITGFAVYYAGGGGGGSRSTPGTGGTGGGGAGSLGGITASGTANTGGGGGGSGNDSEGSWTGTGGTGGSGVVIVRHLISVSQPVTTTGSPIITTTGSYKVYTFTSSGSILFGTAQTALASTNTSFVDSGVNALTVTPTSATQGTFSPYGDNWSNYFNGSSYLSIPTNTALNFGTGDFTIEAWIYTTVSSTDNFIISASGSGGMFFGFTAGGSFGYGRATVAWDYQPTNIMSLNTWYHVALTRSGTSIRMFVNGTQFGTTQTSSQAYDLGVTSTTIGSQGANYYFNGYISNLRVLKGTALYTSAFTPATAPLPVVTNTKLLTAASNRYLDKSGTTSAFTIGSTPSISRFTPFAPGYAYNTLIHSGSAYFNGSNSYLAVQSTTAGDFGTGDFTVEFWMNATAAGTFVAVVGTQSIGGSTAGMWRVSNRLNSANGIYFNYTTGSAFTDITFSTTNYNDGAWHHVAACRFAGTLKMFVDGVSIGTPTAVSQSLTSGQKVYVGYNVQDAAYYSGYVSNLRIVKGVAAYTNSFTPPVSPLPNSQTYLPATGVTLPTALTAYAWGGGGAGGTVGGWTYGSAGGAGGAASGVLAVSPSSTYYITVGGGGAVNSPIATRAVGGGGTMSTDNDNRYAGGGGGYSGIFNSSSSTQAAVLLMAGGGGGGGSSRAGTGNTGGAGGGTVGQDGTSPYDSKTAYAGKGGSQSAAGVDASSDGAQFTGGQGALLGGTPRTGAYGGAGGGGYWGGSAGGYSEANTMAGGGGGSGYFNPTYVSSGVLTAGSGVTPGDNTNTLRGTAGAGGAIATNGSTGTVVIRYADTYSALVTTGNPTVSVSGGYRTYTWTASGSVSITSGGEIVAIASTQTSLLLNGANSGIYDATMNNDVIIVGAATLSPAVTKFNKRSIYINGTSNYISGPSNPLLAFGTSDFTVEMWLYLNVAPASGVELYITGNFHLNFRSATTIAITNDASVLSNVSNNISAGVWTHIAAVRRSGTMTIYLNGIGNTPATGQTFSFTQSGWNTGTGGSGFNGYIDDLRITKGVARYTTNFIPPSAQLKLK